MPKQEHTGLGQLDVVRGPVQQLGSELLLEQPHLATERRLRDMQPLRRAGEVPLLGDGDEVLQPTEIRHRIDASGVILRSVTDAGDVAFFRMLESHRMRAFVRVMRRLPGDPRCAVCHAPYGGMGGRIMGRFGFGPSRKNPRLCSQCFEKAPMGGTEMDVGILFADIRGFTSLAERHTPNALATLLNRFYATAVDVLCEHAIIDKLVGDQVMALYLPGVFPGEPAAHMLADAKALIAAAGDADGQPWVEIGIGLDFGPAFVGNVGSGEVKDFTAIGDVVNTAARLQSAAAGGEIVMSQGVHARASDPGADLEVRQLSLKGKAEPEPAVICRVDMTAPTGP